MKCPFVIKICSKCKRILVANEMNFCKQKGGKYGLKAYCKICMQKEYKEKNFEGNPFNDIDSNKVWNHCPFCIKVCSDCKRILVANEINFNKGKSNKYKLTTRCKGCSCKRTVIYENKIKEKNQKKYKFNNIDINKVWNHCPFCIKICTKCGEILVANGMNFNTDIKGKYKLKSICKKCEREYNSKWKKNNPNKVFNQCINRRIKLKNQGNGITKEQWYEMMEFFDWKCAYSGESISNKDNRTIDHIIPLDKGGLNEVWNCVPMLKLYNCSKYTKNMEEWYIQQDFYSEERLNKIYEWIEYAKNKYQNKP